MRCGYEIVYVSCVSFDTGLTIVDEPIAAISTSCSQGQGSFQFNSWSDQHTSCISH